MNYKLYDNVAATVDLPDFGISAGDKGTIIDIYPDGAYEIEFDPDELENIVTASLLPSQVALADLRQAA